MTSLSPEELLTTTRAVRKRLDLEKPVENELIKKCIEIAQRDISSRQRDPVLRPLYVAGGRLAGKAAQRALETGPRLVVHAAPPFPYPVDERMKRPVDRVLRGR